MTSRPIHRGGPPSGRNESAEAMTETAAIHALAASALNDPQLLGPALLLLSARPTCRISCGPSGPRSRYPG
jgi:hypothetical protein